jgi:hypothetical protein
MERNTAMWALLLLLLSCVSMCTAPAAIAQDPIRVETKEVLVPVFVIDKTRYQDLRRDPRNLFKAVVSGDMRSEESIVERIGIPELTATDLRLYEDGQLQTVDNVSRQPMVHRGIRDNQGFHSEYIGTGGGKWSSREWPPEVIADILPPQYLIEYAPPESPEGSCHKIKIEVNRRKVIVVARGEYCSAKHPASDPLQGTPLGIQMESYLASAVDSNIGVTLTAIPLYDDKNTIRIQIALDWPWKSLKFDSRMLGVLGLVYTKYGVLAQRFSDTSESDSEELGEYKRAFGNDLRDVAPTRYETQLRLPPGEYSLRIALSDGKKFGRSEIPLTIESQGKTLAISPVSLCKQVQNVSDRLSHTADKLPGNLADQFKREYVPLVSNGIEFKVTGNTQFKKGEILYAYFEVVEPLLERDASTNVQIQMRVIDLGSGEVKSDPQPISAMSYAKPGNPVIPIGRGIDIKDLPTGSYRLDVRAADSTGNSTAWRSVNFTVE